MWVDLHVHTSASDGTLSPEEVVRKAKAMGLGCLAITDHDTLDGIQEAIEAGDSLGMMVISGLEMSVDLEQGRSFHLLVYGLDGGKSGFGDFLREIRLRRAERNSALLEKLRSLGFPIDPEEVIEEGDRAKMGRPHIARAMVKKGYVRSMEEAFSKFLGKGGKAYIPKKRPCYREAMRIVREEGGVPVLAHPHTMGTDRPMELEIWIGKLLREGLMGVEVLYPDGPFQLRRFLLELCERRGLLKTGGSDFHGALKPEIELGFGKGDLRVPMSWAEELKERIESAKRVS